jgi:hypothetical protein
MNKVFNDSVLNDDWDDWDDWDDDDWDDDWDYNEYPNMGETD